jgi:hypothetical protein
MVAAVFGNLEGAFGGFTRSSMGYGECRERCGDEGWVVRRTLLDEFRCNGNDLICGEGGLDQSDSAT